MSSHPSSVFVSESVSFPFHFRREATNGKKNVSDDEHKLEEIRGHFAVAASEAMMASASSREKEMPTPLCEALLKDFGRALSALCDCSKQKRKPDAAVAKWSEVHSRMLKFALGNKKFA